MQVSTSTSPFPDYKNCLIRGLPINEPFRIHFEIRDKEIRDKDSQIGSFIILPLESTIHGSCELLDLTEQTLSSSSKSLDESVCQTKVLETLKNYVKEQSVTNDSQDALTPGKLVLTKYLAAKFDKSKTFNCNKAPQVDLNTNCNSGVSWYDSKILPREPTDKIQFVVLDPISQKIGIRMISKSLNLNDATSISNSNLRGDISGTSVDDTETKRISCDNEENRIEHESVSGKGDKGIAVVDKSYSDSASNNVNLLLSEDDMENSTSDFEACDNFNKISKQQYESANVYPNVKIKTEIDSSEYENFTVIQNSDADNPVIKVELNENGMPFKTEDGDFEEQIDVGVYRTKDTSDQVDTGNDVSNINPVFGISHMIDKAHAQKSSCNKRRKISKKRVGPAFNNLYVNSLYARQKYAKPVDKDDEQLKEMQKLKLVKLGADGETNAANSYRRSSRLKSVGFRPDYLNVENKIDEFIAYVGGDTQFSDDENDAEDDIENDYFDDDEGEKQVRTRKPRKKRKESDDEDFDPEHEQFSFKKKFKSKNKYTKIDTENSDQDEATDSDCSVSDMKRNVSSDNKQKKVKEKKPKQEWIKIKLEDHQDKFWIETLDSIARKDRGKSDLEKSVEVYVCTLCKKFKSASVEGIESHLENHVNGKLTCYECSFYASNSGQMLLHRTQMHKHLFSICPECGKELSHRHYKTHLGTIHNKPQYDCNYCEKNGQEVKKFESREHLYKHQREVHKNMGYTCEKCGNVLFRKESFDDHEKICTGGKKIDSKFCERCGKSFSNSTSLRKHTNTVHLKIRTFQCPDCQYSAPSRANLRRHQLVHKGVHPYQCDQCSFTCVQAYQLTSHMRTHTGEKPYKCTQCKYAAAWNVQLKEHVKVHSMDTAVMCQNCDIMFKNDKALNLHVKKEH